MESAPSSKGDPSDPPDPSPPTLPPPTNNQARDLPPTPIPSCSSLPPNRIATLHPPKSYGSLSKTLIPSHHESSGNPSGKSPTSVKSYTPPSIPTNLTPNHSLESQNIPTALPPDFPPLPSASNHSVLAKSPSRLSTTQSLPEGHNFAASISWKTVVEGSGVTSAFPQPIGPPRLPKFLLQEVQRSVPDVIEISPEEIEDRVSDLQLHLLGRLSGASSDFYHSTLHSEADAMKLGLTCCLNKGIQQVKILCDNQTLVNILNNSAPLPWRTANIIENIRWLLQAFVSAKSLHVHISTNCIADFLARKGRTTANEFFGMTFHVKKSSNICTLLCAFLPEK